MAHEFADLHDRSGRMKAKGVVRDILEWKSSREYFYWRVKRRLAENEVGELVMFFPMDAFLNVTHGLLCSTVVHCATLC